jgi:hypothetical protein
VEAWREIELGDALAVLQEWVGRRVVVDLDAAALPSSLAELRFAGASYSDESGSLVFELACPEAEEPVLIDVRIAD